MFNYIGILNKSSTVSHSITCNFLNTQSKLNLVLAKGNIIEIYDITKEGLESIPYLNIYGNIILLEKIQEANNDNIFVLTDDLEFMILTYNKTKNEVVCIEKANIKEDIGNRHEGILYAFDHNSFDFVILSAYKNIFKVVMLRNRSKVADYSIRYDYDEALALFPIHVEDSLKTFSKRASFGFLRVGGGNSVSYDQKSLGLDIFSLNHTKQELQKDYAAVTSSDITSNPCISLIFSPKVGGLVVFYNNYVKYYYITSKLIEKDSQTYSDRRFITYTEIDRFRYLVADEFGNLYVLGIKDDKIVFQYLGEVSYVSSLAYLDNNYIFVGSDKGNSQLVKIIKKSSYNNLSDNTKSPFIEIVEEYDSLAPIMDFTIINSNSEESNTVLCISGVDKTCSLKTIREGTSITIQGKLELSDISNIHIVDYEDTSRMSVDDEEISQRLVFLK
jgi:DNA damage-binding protein 1